VVAPSYERSDQNYTQKPTFTWYALADQCPRHMFQYNMLMNTNPQYPSSMSNQRLENAQTRHECIIRIIALNEYRARAVTTDILVTDFPWPKYLVSGLELGTLSSCTPVFVLTTECNRFIIIDGYSNLFLHAVQHDHAHISYSVFEYSLGQRNYDWHSMIKEPDYHEHLDTLLFWPPEKVLEEQSSGSDSTYDRCEGDSMMDSNSPLGTQVGNSPPTDSHQTESQSNPPPENNLDPLNIMSTDVYRRQLHAYMRYMERHLQMHDTLQGSLHQNPIADNNGAAHSNNPQPDNHNSLPTDSRTEDDPLADPSENNPPDTLLAEQTCPL
jgi:hypothetical protein